MEFWDTSLEIYKHQLLKANMAWTTRGRAPKSNFYLQQGVAPLKVSLGLLIGRYFLRGTLNESSYVQAAASWRKSRRQVLEEERNSAQNIEAKKLKESCVVKSKVDAIDKLTIACEHLFGKTLEEFYSTNEVLKAFPNVGDASSHPVLAWLWKLNEANLQFLGTEFCHTYLSLVSHVLSSRNNCYDALEVTLRQHLWKNVHFLYRLNQAFVVEPVLLQLLQTGSLQTDTLERFSLKDYRQLFVAYPELGFQFLKTNIK